MSQSETKYPPPFSLRLTAEEREILNARAKNRSLGAYIREKLLGEQASHRTGYQRRPTVDDAALGKALGALGSSRLAANMNQIAKAANMGALPVTPELEEELHAACCEIGALRHALIMALGIEPKS